MTGSWDEAALRRYRDELPSEPPGPTPDSAPTTPPPPPPPQQQQPQQQQSPMSQPTPTPEPPSLWPGPPPPSYHPPREFLAPAGAVQQPPIDRALDSLIVEASRLATGSPPTAPTGFAALLRSPTTRRRIARTVGVDNFPDRFVELSGAAARPISTGRRIVVTSAGGGVGVTALTVLLALSWSGARADNGAVMVARHDFGALTRRLGLAGGPSVQDLLAGPAAATGVLAPSMLEAVNPRLHAIPSDELYVPSAQHRDLFAMLSRGCAISTLDAGPLPAAVDLLPMAHSVVLATSTGPGPIRQTASCLAALLRSGHLRRDRLTIAVIESQTPARQHLDRALAELHPLGLPLQPIPFDQQIAEDGEIFLDQVQEPTRLATLALAGTTLAQAVGQP